jgi:glycine/D-amino acid oxidase-like deaminating enzyme
MLSFNDLLAIEPNIALDVAGGAFFEEDSQVNPLFATQSLAHAAQQLGAVFETFTEAIGFEFTAGKSAISAVITNRGKIPTGAVVIATGAWSSQLGDLIGLNIPVIPRKGTLIVTVPVQQELIRTKVILAAGYMDAIKSSCSCDIAVAANIQQMPNGNLLLGSSRQFVGFDTDVDPAVIIAIVRRNLRFFPILSDVMAIRFWAGCRPYTPDLLPIISTVEEIKGLFLACGHEGIGITEGPITGKLIYQLVTGQNTSMSLEQLSFDRFSK